MKYIAVGCWVFLCLLALLIVLKSAAKSKIQASNALLSKLRKQDPAYVAKIKKIHTFLLCLVFLLLTVLTLRVFQVGDSTTSTSGSTLIILLDNSASMGTRDVGNEQTRLDLAKSQIKELLKQNPGLQVRLLSFSSSVLPRTEVTDNASAVFYALDNVNTEPKFAGSGSNLDNALQFAQKELSESQNTQTSLLIIGDGEQIGETFYNQAVNINQQTPKPKSTLILGVGSESGGDIEYFSYEHNKDLKLGEDGPAQTTTSAMDSGSLEQTAAALDGSYLELSKDTNVSEISSALQLKAARGSIVKGEYYSYVALALFATLILYEVNPYLTPRGRTWPKKAYRKERAHE